MHKTKVQAAVSSLPQRHVLQPSVKLLPSFPVQSGVNGTESDAEVTVTATRRTVRTINVADFILCLFVCEYSSKWTALLFLLN